MKKLQSSKKMTQVAIASTAGIALLLGGGTYALWSASAPLASESTITAGDLRVTALSSQNWFDVTDSSNTVELLTLDDFLMVPGDKLQLNQELNVVVVGDNISGKLKIRLPNSTESAALLSQAKFTLKIFDSTGEELVAATPSVNSNAIEVEVENLPPTSTSGSTYNIQLLVELPESSDNATKLQTSVLEDAIITLEQGPAYVLPFRIVNRSIPEARAYTTYGPVTFETVGGEDTVTYTATGVPAGMTFNNATGVLSGKPTGEARTVEIVVTAKDSAGKQVSKTYNLRIEDPILTTVSTWDFDGAETETTNWTGGANVERPSIAITGSSIYQVASASITNNGARAYSPSSLTLQTGKTYKVSAWVYPANVESSRIRLVHDSTSYDDVVRPVGQWSKVTAIITAKTSNSIRISSTLPGGSTNGGSARAIFYIDNIVIEQIN